MFDQRVSSYSFNFFLQSTDALFWKQKAASDLQIARPVVRFTETVELREGGSLLFLQPMSFGSGNAFVGETYHFLELADLNMRTHKVVEAREEIELSLVLHNRGPHRVPFGSRQVPLADGSGVFKLDHVNTIKADRGDISYSLKSNVSAPFHERYEIIPFEERVAALPPPAQREKDSDDFLHPLQLSEFKFIHSSVIDELNKIWELHNGSGDE
jgi:hypothetical protein